MQLVFLESRSLSFVVNLSTGTPVMIMLSQAGLIQYG